MKKILFICVLLIFPLLSISKVSKKELLYQGKLFDATTQWPNKNYSLTSLTAKFKSANISKAGIFINTFYPTKTLISESSKEIDGNKLFIKGSPKYFHFEDAVNKSKIDDFIKEIKLHKYQFISEIMYRHADKREGITTPHGERTIAPLSKDSIYLIKRIHEDFPSMPIFVHWEFYQWSVDWPLFSQLFKMFPTQKFVINHMGFGSDVQVEEILKNHSNVYFTISKRNVKFEYFRNPKLPQGEPLADKEGRINVQWKKLFTNYSDKFLFSTDSHKNYMWDNYFEIVQDYRKILYQLPETVSEKIAFKNAEKIFNLN